MQLTDGRHRSAATQFLICLVQRQEAERAAAKERKEREKREREAHKKLARDTEEAERRRRKAAAADAAANYRTLLSENVKDTEASWADWRVRLAKDPQVCGSASHTQSQIAYAPPTAHAL